jgi:hypothetical protein
MGGRQQALGHGSIKTTEKLYNPWIDAAGKIGRTCDGHVGIGEYYEL